MQVKYAYFVVKSDQEVTFHSEVKQVQIVIGSFIHLKPVSSDRLRNSLTCSWQTAVKLNSSCTHARVRNSCQWWISKELDTGEKTATGNMREFNSLTFPATFAGFFLLLSSSCRAVIDLIGRTSGCMGWGLCARWTWRGFQQHWHSCTDVDCMSWRE